MEYLKVSSKSSPASVAGAIAGMVKDGVPVNIQSVGAGAVPDQDDLVIAVQITENPVCIDGRPFVAARFRKQLLIEAVMEIKDMQGLEVIGLMGCLEELAADPAVDRHGTGRIKEQEYLNGIFT